MRHTIKGAAALAAFCAGALALGPAAYADGTAADTSAHEYGTVSRIAGVDRSQTAEEAFTVTAHNNSNAVKTVFIVGKFGLVDALTLAPLATKLDGDAAVLYADPKDGLSGGALAKLGSVAHDGTANVFVIGGTGSVPAVVDQQVGSPTYSATSLNADNAHVYRVAGSDRFDTAYQVGAFVVDDSTGKNVSTANAKYERANIAKLDVDRAQKEFQDAQDAALKAEQAEQKAAQARDEAVALIAKYTKGIATEADVENALVGVTTTDKAGARSKLNVINQSLDTLRTTKYTDQADTNVYEKGTTDNVDESACATNVAAEAQASCKSALEALANVLGYEKQSSGEYQDSQSQPVTWTAFRADVEDEIAKLNSTLNSEVAKNIDELAKKAGQYADYLANKDKIDAQLKAYTEAKIAAREADTLKQKLWANLNTAASALKETAAWAYNNAKVTEPYTPENATLQCFMDNNARTDNARATKCDAAAAAKYATELDAALGGSAAAVATFKYNYDQAVKNAWESNTHAIFLADGIGQSDALVAGPVAARIKGVPTMGYVGDAPLLLTNGSTITSATKNVINDDFVLLHINKDNGGYEGVPVFTVGGAASKAFYKGADDHANFQIVGADRYDTAVKLAAYAVNDEQQPMTNAKIALASGETFADAVTSGVFVVSNNYAATLLTKKNTLPDVTRRYLSFGTGESKADRAGSVSVFGGIGSISDDVFNAVGDALQDN